MQISNYATNRHSEASLLISSNKQDLRLKSKKMNPKKWNPGNEAPLSLYRDKKYMVHQESARLRGIQNIYYKTQDKYSYLEKLQRVLERFKELNREIVKEMISPKENPKGDNLIQKSKLALNDISLLLKENRVLIGSEELKVLTDVVQKENGESFNNLLDNKKLSEKLDHILSDLAGKRLKLWNHLKELENATSQTKLSPQIKELVTSIQNNKIPSVIYNYLKPEQAMKLLM